MATEVSELPDYMKDPNVVLLDNVEWANGTPPDYSVVNQLYEKEKSKSHVAGSLEDLVTNLVKNWEREASHKKNMADLRTVDLSNFRFSSNGKWMDGESLGKIGNYNALIGDCEYYAASRLSSHESHDIFRSALTRGFAWECLEVYSGPPTVAFKWRHWGYVTGPLRCPMRNGQDVTVEPKGQKVEIFGISVAKLNDNFKITELETYWNPSALFQAAADEN